MGDLIDVAADFVEFGNGFAKVLHFDRRAAFGARAFIA
jgi:hypothetical protein